MPELPDVEGFRKVFTDHAAGATVTSVRVRDTGVLRGVSARQLGRSLEGKRFGTPRRYGKWLIAPLDERRAPAGRGGSGKASSGETGGASGGSPGTAGDQETSSPDTPALLLHFGMTGSLHWYAGPTEPHRHDRVVLELDDGELHYRDMRKLKGLRLAHDTAEVDAVLDVLGPDAAEVSRTELRQLLTRRDRTLKPALVDQALIAGLGNLLADEILWQARIHPRRTTRSLSDDEHHRLHRSVRSVLRRSIPTGRVPPRKSWLTGRRDDPSGDCPRCGTTLTRARIGGRTAVWCPRCQAAP